MEKTLSTNKSYLTALLLPFLISGSWLLFIYSCTSSAGSPGPQNVLQSLPVISLKTIPATTYQEFTASIEGSKDIEIRSQVDGTLDQIFVDEGAFVRKGQNLFRINERPYREQYNNANATLAAAKANLANASINVTKLTPLVQNNVISDVQLKTAKASYDAAAANVAQAEAMVKAAAINLGYTIIKSPVEGYISRIPYKTGSLVSTNTAEPLTVVSAIRDIYAYFSFSEKEFLEFTHQFSGATIEQKLKQFPAVELVLADNSVYSEKGKIETVSGSFNNNIGAISFRAVFPNTNGLLRSGNTGRIRIPRSEAASLVIPQEATFEIQDKIFVFAVGDSNKVQSKPINVLTKTGTYYIIGSGLNAGDRIVFAGLERLRDGIQINPENLSLDSLIKAKPL